MLAGKLSGRAKFDYFAYVLLQCNLRMDVKMAKSADTVDEQDRAKNIEKKTQLKERGLTVSNLLIRATHAGRSGQRC